MNFHSTFILCSTIFVICESVHDSYNLIVDPKRRECFYHDFPEGSKPHYVEAFVQGGGNIDLSLQVFGPLTIDKVLSETFEKPVLEERIDSSQEIKSDTQSFTIRFDPQAAGGTYAFCLDNRRSHFIPKFAQLDLHLAPKGLEEDESNESEEENPTKEGGESEESLERVKESITRIRKDLVRIQLQQRRDRHRLALHSEANETSHNRVIISSLVETFVFVVASLFQIFFVRRWFSSRGHGKKSRA